MGVCRAGTVLPAAVDSAGRTNRTGTVEVPSLRRRTEVGARDVFQLPTDGGLLSAILRQRMRRMKWTRQLKVSKRRVDGGCGAYARVWKIAPVAHASTCFVVLSLVFDHGLHEQEQCRSGSRLTDLPSSGGSLTYKTEHYQLKTPPQAEIQIPSRKNAHKRALRQRWKSAGLLEQRLVSFG